MGNLRSVAKALEAAGAHVRLAGHPGEAEPADALCIPGQGIFGRCMEALRSSRFAELVREWTDAGRPFLGICLGMQVLFESSEEGGVAGLGILGGTVKRLPGGVVVPHIGWNTVASGTGDTYYYFDHSYAVHAAEDSIVSGWTDHGGCWAASVRTGSITGVQFHPEKSGRDGIALLRRWRDEAV